MKRRALVVVALVLLLVLSGCASKSYVYGCRCPSWSGFTKESWCQAQEVLLDSIRDGVVVKAEDGFTVFRIKALGNVRLAQMDGFTVSSIDGSKILEPTIIPSGVELICKAYSNESGILEFSDIPGEKSELSVTKVRYLY